jgi:hypothetical protein
MIRNPGAQAGHENIRPAEGFSLKLEGGHAAGGLEEKPVGIHDPDAVAAAARFLGDAPDAVQGFIPAKNGESQPIILSGSGTTYGTHRRFGPLHPPDIYSDRTGETTE